MTYSNGILRDKIMAQIKGTSPIARYQDFEEDSIYR
jgi:hypothetical protein